MVTVYALGAVKHTKKQIGPYCVFLDNDLLQPGNESLTRVLQFQDTSGESKSKYFERSKLIK